MGNMRLDTYSRLLIFSRYIRRGRLKFYQIKAINFKNYFLTGAVPAWGSFVFKTARPRPAPAVYIRISVRNLTGEGMNNIEKREARRRNCSEIIKLYNLLPVSY